jgi:EAL domain-containing protein (putative c-di-GMP-specific phosphodiesterase class I)/GGDEF domain-containing protein
MPQSLYGIEKYGCRTRRDLRFVTAASPRLEQHGESALSPSVQGKKLADLLTVTSTAQVGTADRTSESGLQLLIDEGALFPVFQPIIDLRRGTVWGHEALIRGPMDTPLHAPMALFALASAASRVVEFELHCVAVVLDHWQVLDDPGRLFLNLGANALIAAVDGGRPGWLEGMLASHRIEAKSVTVEITEQEAAGDLAALRHAVITLRSFGASVALDDFGDGHSNLRLWAELRPDFIKADKFFIQGISTNPQKLDFLRAIVALAEIQGTTLIAEGVEEADDLRFLCGLGIGHGQGYLLGRPTRQLLSAIAPGVTQALVSKHAVVLTRPGMHSGRNVLRSLVLCHAPTLDPWTPIDEVSTLFQTSPELHALPVLSDGRPVAVINRQSFMNDYARLYFRELHGRRPCLGYANRSPRVVELDDSEEDLVGILMSEDQRYLSDGFIVIDQGRYIGLGTGEQLVRAVTEARVEAARHANPLTFLPGNVPISIHIDRLLAGGSGFVACYADLNNFKVFNDHYGYWRGDEMIRLFARLATRHADPDRDFVGHIGGDDFLMLLQSPDWQRRCDCMMLDFAVEALALYDAPAREAGGIEGADRHGVIRFFPCTTVSIGAACIEAGTFRHAEDVANEATAAKHDAKLAATGFIVRRAAPPIELKPGRLVVHLSGNTAAG